MSTPSNVNDEATNTALHGKEVSNEYLVDPDTGQPYDSGHPFPVNATLTPPANQRVNAQSGDFVANSITDLATLLTLSGTPTDANTVNSLMGRLTKIRDLLNATLQVSQIAAQSVSGTLQSAATTTGAGTALSLLGNASVIFTVSGSYTGLIMAFQGTEDNSNYSNALSVTQLGTSTILTSITGNGLYECSVAGLQKVQANISAIASGSVTVTAHSVPLAFTTRVNDVTDRWARQAGQVDIARVLGSAIGNTNPVPSQDIEQANYTAATSPPTATNAGSDTAYTFSSQVSRVIIQNNTSANVNYAFDTAASAGSLLLAPGAMLVYPKKCTVLHLYTAAAQNINGSTAANIVVLGAI